jgi:hypothetical protein
VIRFLAACSLAALLASCAGRQVQPAPELVHPEHLLRKAGRALADRDLTLAQSFTIRALEADSTAWRAHSIMAQILLEKGLFEAARWEAERAITLGPNRFQAQLQRARVLIEVPGEGQLFERSLQLADSLGADRRELTILRAEAAISQLKLNQALDLYASLPQDSGTLSRMEQIALAMAESGFSRQSRLAILQDPLRLGGCACLLVEAGGLEKLLVQSGRLPRTIMPIARDTAGQLELLAMSGLLRLPDDEWLSGRAMSHSELESLLNAFSLFKQGHEPADSDERLDKVSDIDPLAPRDGGWFLNRLREIP